MWTSLDWRLNLFFVIVKYKDSNSEIRFCWPMKFFGLNLTLGCAWTWDSGLGLVNFLLHSKDRLRIKTSSKACQPLCVVVLNAAVIQNVDTPGERLLEESHVVAKV